MARPCLNLNTEEKNTIFFYKKATVTYFIRKRFKAAGETLSLTETTSSSSEHEIFLFRSRVDVTGTVSRDGYFFEGLSILINTGTFRV
jgi:hypothetical protein